MRSRSIALSLALLAGLAVPRSQPPAAGPRSPSRTLRSTRPQGQEATIDLRVLQHGKTPVSWPAITVVATDATSGAVIRAKAAGDRARGLVRREARLPERRPVDADVRIDRPRHGGLGRDARRTAGGGGRGRRDDGRGSDTSAAFDAAPLLGLLFIVFALVVAGGLVLRTRAARAGTRVSPGPEPERDARTAGVRASRRLGPWRPLRNAKAT